MSRQEFEAVFPSIVDEFIGEISKTQIAKNALEWVRDALEYNTPGGKLNRGLSVVDTYSLITGSKPVGEEYKRVAILGWTVELLQAFFLVADDIMDGSVTRRGHQCWYRRQGVGMTAINDAFVLESVIYVLLKKHFRSEPYYIDLVELFHDVTLDTELGQLLDLITAPEDEVDLSKFSLDKYTYIVTYKTAFYSFYLPVVLALYVAGKATHKNLEQCRKVLLPLGAYFQVQDDFLDNYGDPEITGKIGTDIQDNKCGWLINIALEKATPEQRRILDENYGKKDPEAESRVKKLYDELKLEGLYREYEESEAKKISDLISTVDESEGLKKAVFTTFFEKIYRRQK